MTKERLNEIQRAVSAATGSITLDRRVDIYHGYCRDLLAYCERLEGALEEIVNKVRGFQMLPGGRIAHDMNILLESDVPNLAAWLKERETRGEE